MIFRANNPLGRGAVSLREKSLVLVITLAISILAVHPINKPVSGHGGDTLSAWASRTPIINGYIKPVGVFEVAGKEHVGLFVHSPAEWEDADTVSFTLNYDGEDHNATLYVMNDYINLYLALKIEDEDYNRYDYVRFAFDNDHNGGIDVGDNYLDLFGDSDYIDSFYDNMGSILSDVLDDGFNDGVGAVQFRAIDGDYHFEIAFPLNTADNDHDFSLSLGESVGFSAKFYDSDIARADWWPSQFVDAWADITIAVPLVEPPPSLADLTITRIEATQAIQYLNNSLPLVQTKATVVRVYVATGILLFGIDVTVYLFGLDQGRTLGALKKSYTAPGIPDRGITWHTANFLLPLSWVSGMIDRLTLKAFVKTSRATQSELNYDNNWMIVDGSPERSFVLARTYNPTIYTTRIDSEIGPDQQVLSWDRIYALEEFFETIYPVAHVNYVRLPDTETSELGHDINVVLEETYADDYDLNTIRGDQIFGYNIWNNGFAGLSDVAANGGGYWEGTEMIMAHEINHNWGPDGSWGNHISFPDCEAPGPDPDWPYPDATIQEFGFNTQTMTVVDDDAADVASYCGPPDWISPYRWQKVFNRLLPWEGVADTAPIQPTTTESLRISGWINQNGTGSLNPIFRLSEANESISIPGNYSLILKDSTGSTLLTHSFQAQFLDEEGVPYDSYYFRKRLPLIPGTVQVLLTFENTTILDTITMSQNAPTVRVLSPNGGEVWNPDVQTITWESEDLDGAPLAYRLYYIGNTGTSWIPISPIIEGTSSIMSYQINASSIPGSNTALILVVASDGFNVGQDLSDSVFSVADKPPIVRIIRPQMESQFHMDDVILLRGKAHDVDDVILPQTAYNWTSSVDGYLGSGETLTTMLTPGTHNVTLAVIDSKGNTVEDTVEITVNLDIVVTEIIPYKTVVGQNSSVHINVTIENRGRSTQSFNLTAQANTTAIETQTISNLTSGNSTTATFAWNTTDFANGNYDLTVTATLTEYEITTKPSETHARVLITIPGDVNGDRIVDIFDIGYISAHWYPGPPIGPSGYHPNADTNDDSAVDIFDIGITSAHWGQSW